MKKLSRKIIVLAVAGCFLAVGLVGRNSNAQTKNPAKPTPTPKAKKSPTVNSKATPKPTPKSTPKTGAQTTTKTPIKTKSTTSQKEKSATAKTTPAVVGQVIVTATASRIRQEPKNNSTLLSGVKLGKVLPVSEKDSGWYQVEYAKGKSGWISKTLVKDFDADERDDVYAQIVDKYYKAKTLDFPSAAEVLEFMRIAQASVAKDQTKADLGLKRLQFLRSMLRKIPAGKGEQPPYKNFIKANNQEIVYSEPAGEWYVRSELFWQLHGRFTALPIGEEIAWEAAQNPIPGECEGYINCYLYNIRVKDGEYLNFYPNGKYTKDALKNIRTYLEPFVADIREKSVYTPPSDISDRAEFNRFLTELRTIISKVPDLDKNKPLQQISQLGEGYK